MGGCDSKEKEAPQKRQDKVMAGPRTASEQLRQVPAKSALKKSVVDGRAPLVVLDFDLTLTVVHCGRMKLDSEGVQRLGAGEIFDQPPGRLRSIRNFITDLYTELRATVIILTLNRVDVVATCLTMAGLNPYITEVIHCSPGRKGSKMRQLIEQYVPSLTIFADDDSRNIADVHAILPDITILHVEGSTGLQPAQMEWLYYAAKGDLATYTSLQGTV
eukprot:TRINITY_DN43151_c0_g1_i1.p1 TRINITY_DN43151_c0_g1~~TRINITY_DN43151_c0_g1_i1.p1  ORF type:complete len:217 (+),score=27.58 TRINITY_DN43151_c0_g1_i1:112-762(+)